MLQKQWLAAPGLVAILRGITPPESVEIAAVILGAGFSALEVPLNSPNALESIAQIRAAFPEGVIGAGTVLSVEGLTPLASLGVDFIVTPNLDAQVLSAANALDLPVMPGVATPSEAFAALKLGAAALKVFPAAQVGLEGFRAWRSVLPPEVALIPVGGVGPHNIAPWRAAGAKGVGIGGELYRPGDQRAQVGHRAHELVERWKG